MELRELYEKVKYKEILQNKLKELHTQNDELVSKVSSLETIMLKEKKDVDTLEKGGLASFFYEITGKKEQKLDKEKSEAYEAKVKYDNAFYQLSEVKKEIELHEKKMDELTGCEEQYEEALHKKQSELRESNPQLTALEKEMVSAQLLQKEIKEAIAAGEDAKDIAGKVKKELDEADSWATFDLVGGGIFADLAKYESLDEVEHLIKELQAKLNLLKTELTDVKIESDIQVVIGDFLKFADCLFDNFFTDFEVMGKIDTALSQINATIEQIDDTLLNLTNLLEDEKNKENTAQEELERIILNSVDK